MNRTQTEIRTAARMVKDAERLIASGDTESAQRLLRQARSLLQYAESMSADEIEEVHNQLSRFTADGLVDNWED